MTEIVHITRHEGARVWLNDYCQAKGLAAPEVISHMTPEMIKGLTANVVVGSIPMSLASRICTRGVHYYCIEMDVPEAARGKELTADDMRAYGAELVKYEVERK